MTDVALLELAADIVTAHVANNPVSPDELPRLIQSVYGSLAKLGQPEETVEEKRAPAVSIRSSIKPDTIACLECGARLKTLKRHLGSEHGLTAGDYRARWNLPADYPMIAPDYAEKRKAIALEIGLGARGGRKKGPAKSATNTAAPTPEGKRRPRSKPE